MDGLSQYILNVTSRLPRHEDRHYTIVVRPDECPERFLDSWREQGMTVLTAPIAPIGPLRERQFKQWLRTQPSFDAALVPSNQYPLALAVPTVYVVHDIIYERYPNQLGKRAFWKRWWLHYNVAKGLQKASRVVAVSRFTKQEILHFHPQVDAQKISVVYEGWEHLENHSKTQTIDVPFREYILYVGSTRGHKNIQGLLDAMTITAPHLPEKTGLVIAGDDRMLNAHQRQQLENLRDRVRMTGWLDSDALDAYCRQAKAMIFPSLCEGFGIPVLEAFYYRKPLLLSNASSLPEVAGDAALYFDPHQPEEIAARIEEALCMTADEQTKWIKKGEARLKVFSWQKTADEIDGMITNLLR